ncbi:GGDEF domain-containing protein [Desulfobacterales bacterium HSG17]|nr:GGDEF domain-containing protein [Desulfobacterales bacterium HSG17]
MTKDSTNHNKHSHWMNFHIYGLLASIILVTIGIHYFLTSYIHPQFLKELIHITEKEAVRTGKHMKKFVLDDYVDGQIHISGQTSTFLKECIRNFDLWKIKIFSDTGETIYSTSAKDIGKINTHDYFHNIVAKGTPYSKLVKKDTKTLEGILVYNDIVETYFPMILRGQFVGAFEFYYDITTRRKSMDNLVKKFSTMSYALTLLIISGVLFTTFLVRRGTKERRRFENALVAMAIKDRLTGIYNRHGFEELAQGEYEKGKRYQRNSCIILFDLDHFKKVNDTYGHQAGDHVLSSIAQKCLAGLRNSDIFGRYGGEEFIIFLPETDCDGGMETAEKIRQSIASQAIPTDQGDLDITISMGLSCYTPQKPLSVDELIKQADDALYQAKENGRNQLVSFQQKIGNS